MNTGQTMMIILAMMLLGILSLSVNRTLINTSSTSLEMEAELDAISIGQSMLDEILSRSFDQKTISTRVFAASGMSSVLAAEPADEITLPDSSYTGAFQSLIHYNDVDDYNKYRRIVTNSRLGAFNINDTVTYASETSPDSAKSFKTFCKRITVYITSPFMIKNDSGIVVPLVMRDAAIYRKYF